MIGGNTFALVRALALDLLVMVLSLSVHECAHAWVAYRLGDDTAQRAGRLSLSPVSHVDPLGTLLIPALNLILAGGFGFIGWARPTPVSPEKFRPTVPPRAGMALVAAAGPTSNFLLAVMALGVFAVMQHAGMGLFDERGRPSAVAALAIAMFQVNVGLMVFNFLPIPPLDGSRLLPRSFDQLQKKLAPYSLWILLIIINVRFLSDHLVSQPIRLVMLLLQALFGVHIVGGPMS